MKNEKDLTNFLSQVKKLTGSQPPASDLDAVDRFMRNLNAIYARWAHLNGVATSVLSQLTYQTLKEIGEEDFKRIKNSSTLTTEYVQGTYPEITALCIEIQQTGYVLKSVADNYRTLVSSYRLEREIDSKTIRNTTNQN